MSVAVLKRKSKAKYFGSLTRNGEFSLKGDRRNTSRIGVTQENSVVRPLFIGGEDGANIPRGYGGLPPRSTRSCGTTKCSDWPIYMLCDNGVTSQSYDCTQTSTKTTKGYIESKLINPTDCGENGEKCRPNWVKSFNPLDHSQGEYIRKLKVYEAGFPVVEESPIPDRDCNPGDPACTTYMLGTRKITRDNHFKNANHGAVSVGEYLATQLLRNKCLPPPPCKAPFPFIINKSSCRTEYLTPQDAIDDGALPKDWMNCKTNHTHNKKTGCLYNPYGDDLHCHHRPTPYPPSDPNSHSNPITTLVPNNLTYNTDSDSLGPDAWTKSGSTYTWTVPRKTFAVTPPYSAAQKKTKAEKYYENYNDWNTNKNLLLTSIPVQVNIENEHVGYPVPVTVKIYPKNSSSEDIKYFLFYVYLYINDQLYDPNGIGWVMLHEKNACHWYNDLYIKSGDKINIIIELNMADGAATVHPGMNETFNTELIIAGEVVTSDVTIKIINPGGYVTV